MSKYLKFVLLSITIFFVFISIFVVSTYGELKIFKEGLPLTYNAYRGDKKKFKRTVGPGLKNWTSMKDIPVSCRTALVAAEDSSFYSHFGIDLTAIKDSFLINSRYKKMKFGGSTITQQLVKNAFLTRKQSFTRKISEAFKSIALSLIIDKNTQLAWYFNIIEFGPSIYGIREASRYYFDEAPSDLSPSQCIALVVIIPSPIKWGASLKKEIITDFFKSRYENILRRMRRMRLTPEDDIKLAYYLSPFGSIWESHTLEDILVDKNSYIYKINEL